VGSFCATQEASASKRWRGEAAESGRQAAYSAGGGEQRSCPEVEENGLLCKF